MSLHTPNRTITYRGALNEALMEEMARDDTIIVLGEDIAKRGGSFKITKGLLERFGEKRVLDTPIAEAGFTGMALGAAITGLRPVVEISFVDFTMLAMDQIVNQIAKHHFLTGGQRRVPLVIRTQEGVGTGLAAQHSQRLEALFYHIPGLRLAVPSTPHDAKGLLKQALRSDFPVLFLEHKKLYDSRGPVPGGEYTVAFGSADVKRTGEDVTLIAWSRMVPLCLDAAAALSPEGISCEVIDMRTLVPMDWKSVLSSAAKTGRVLIAQEANRRGGVASDIASVVQEQLFAALKAPVAIVAGRNTPVPFNERLEQHVIPHADDVVRAVRKLMD